MGRRYGLIGMLLALSAPGCLDPVGEREAAPGEIEVSDRLRVVEDVDEVVVEFDRLRFPAQTHGHLRSLRPDDLVVGDRHSPDSLRQQNPSGFLRRVVSVQEVGGEIIVQTEHAYLNEALTNGQAETTLVMPPSPEPLGPVAELKVDGVPGAMHWGPVDAGAGTADASDDELTLQPRTTAAPVLFTGLRIGPFKVQSQPRDLTLGGQPMSGRFFVSVQIDIDRGEFDFSPDVDLGMDLAQGRIEDFKVALRGHLESQLKTRTRIDFGYSAAPNLKEILGEASPQEQAAFVEAFQSFVDGDGGFPALDAKIAEARYFLPTWYVPTPVGVPVPVVSEAVFQLNLSCSVQAKGRADLESSADLVADVEIGARYNDDDGWSKISEFEHVLGPGVEEVTTSLIGQVGCSVRPTFNIFFYGVAGPNIWAGAGLTGKLEASRTCPGLGTAPLVDVKARLIGYLGAGVGAKLGLFLPQIKDIQLAKVELDIFEIWEDLASWEIYSGYPSAMEAVLPCDVSEPDPEPACGDNVCDGDETCDSCPEDCGSCDPPPGCGDAICERDETCMNCEADCGACDPCLDAGSGDGHYCGSSIGGDPGVLYTCNGQTTTNTVSCGYGCATCDPGVPDTCKYYPGQTDDAACGVAPPECWPDVVDSCDSVLEWCAGDQCSSCNSGWVNCDGLDDCECQGYCSPTVEGLCCPDDQPPGPGCNL